VLVGVIAHLRDIIDAEDEKVRTDQAKQIRNLELKLAELQAANKLLAAEDKYALVKLPEHDIV
jgi:hypothetical protein